MELQKEKKRERKKEREKKKERERDKEKNQPQQREKGRCSLHADAEIVKSNSHSDHPKKSTSAASQSTHGISSSTSTSVSAVATSTMSKWTVDGDEDDAPCVMCLCGECDDEDPMIICDGPCGQCVHISCFGLSSVPSGDFFCENCEPEHQKIFPRPRCALCFRSDGFMNRTHDHQYTHPVCASWMQELLLDSNGRALSLARLDPERKKLACVLCKKTGGACLQCAYGMCWEAVHPYCAFAARRQMTLRADETGIQYALFCNEHAPFVLKDDALMASLRPIDPLPAHLHFREDRSDEVRRVINVDAGADQSIATVDGAMLGEDQDPIVDTQDEFAQLIDSSEKLSRSPGLGVPKRKRLRRVRDRASRGEVKGIGNEEEDEAERLTRKQRKKEKDEQVRRLVGKFFEHEAALSGSASDDESCGDKDSQGFSQALSGDFINDGDYTQATPATDCKRKGKGKSGGSADGMALYYRVNCALESQSPLSITSVGDSPALRLGFRGAERGLPLLQRLLRKHRERKGKEARANVVFGRENMSKRERKDMRSKQRREDDSETPKFTQEDKNDEGGGDGVDEKEGTEEEALGHCSDSERRYIDAGSDSEIFDLTHNDEDSAVGTHFPLPQTSPSRSSGFVSEPGSRSVPVLMIQNPPISEANTSGGSASVIVNTGIMRGGLVRQQAPAALIAGTGALGTTVARRLPLQAISKQRLRQSRKDIVHSPPPLPPESSAAGIGSASPAWSSARSFVASNASSSDIESPEGQRHGQNGNAVTRGVPGSTRAQLPVTAPPRSFGTSHHEIDLTDEW
jgi:hypothetical protein